MRATAIGFAAVALLAATAGPAGALPADKHVVLEADDGQGCLADAKTDCFRVANGTLDGFSQGMRVHVILENVGSRGHSVFAAKSANADANHVDTPTSAAINGTDTIDPGQSTNLTFTIPQDADGLYLWCDVGNHETGGMWLNASVTESVEVTPEDPKNRSDGNRSNGSATQTGDEATGVPGPGAGLVLATILGATIAIRRPGRGRR